MRPFRQQGKPADCKHESRVDELGETANDRSRVRERNCRGVTRKRGPRLVRARRTGLRGAPRGIANVHGLAFVPVYCGRAGATRNGFRGPDSSTNPAMKPVTFQSGPVIFRGLSVAL